MSCKRLKRLIGGRSLALAMTAALVGTLPAGDASANICWGYSGLPAVNPQPWATMTGILGCPATDGLHPAGSAAGQVIGEEHRNWHCRFPIPSNLASLADQDAYGRAFLAFHRQFILDFDDWRLANTGHDRLEIWDPFQGAQVPGEDETTSTAFTHCSNPMNVRPAGAVCAGCQNLPNQFIGGNLDGFDNLGDIGYELELDWHGSYHNGVRVLGCPDIGGFLHTPRDPAFWMAHKKLDEVAREWQSRQATDVVIVVDRSGSMIFNCSSATPPLSEHPCSINDARDAARHFAKLMLDVRLQGGMPAADQHRVGLVSFASGAVNDLAPAGLVSANGVITENGMDDTDFEMALAGISAGGNTSIAAGIREALAILAAEPDPNRNQAILVLTDGKENTAPCLEGATAPCLSGDVLTSAEVGEVQIVAIGIGEGAEESNLRTVAERHGGIFIGLEDIDDTMALEKFFVTAFGEIFDAGIATDPIGVLLAGDDATPVLDIPMCDDERLTVVGGTEPAGQDPMCDLELELVSPSGNKVLIGDPGVEGGEALRQDFLHVNLPFLGEQRGNWQARLVRREPDQSRRCGEVQRYYLGSLVRGLGRVDPFPARPNLVPGRRVLAAFRINETNRPIGGFDAVKAEVELTRPNGQVQTLPLYDDGTNGDKLAGNNIWSVEFPTPVDELGIYHLRARFELSTAGCTRTREAAYSVVAEREPESCASLVAGGPLGAFLLRRFQPGEVRQVEELACVWNRCGRADRYRVEVADTRHWLKTLTRDGQLVRLPDAFETPEVPGFATVCFGRGPDEGNKLAGIPILADVPGQAKVGDVSEVVVRVTPLAAAAGGSAIVAASTVEVSTRIEIAPPPDCNANLVDDAVDITDGTSKDELGDGIPDECQGDHFHPPGSDSDGDGWTDETDNCTDVPNAGQRDTDGDGFGNLCDPDLNNDNIVNVLDIGLFKKVFLTDDPHADLDGNGIVNVLDVGRFKPFFGGPPGPSGRAQ